MVFAMLVPAFAVSSSKSVSGYGTLKGTLTDKNGISFKTSVTKNPDDATLTYEIEYVNVAGKTLVHDQSSAQNVVTISGTRSSRPSGTSTIFGAHGVQGGSKYGSQVVYTKIKV
jgi:hypothetical protein